MALKKRKKPATKVMMYAKYNDEYTADLTWGYDLVPVLGMAEEALVYQVGAEKHGEDSWRTWGKPWSVALVKINRHLGKFLSGESRCPKDGQHHLASVKFWCNALMEYQQTCPELDDITEK